MARDRVLERAKAPTGRNLKQDEYWQSLERSFNKDFIEVAREKYDKRKRLPLD
ncbi:hypothetical protein OZX74_06190 [Bifidobacterium sp. ESL0798]|uniref:hypothetical protein n=1 Tax=unclassified Bifidobacterium TaxID=2608897 RepID=UPI0023F99FDC|nr:MULTISPECIES: hypothetical protein [unclassified Bifidobacterium]WEV53506.1 hypothetical protein OZX64_03310 [Bifidobacterium sp. ESL0704]WEV73520.1 hypothetical protein OZX74_06190 [Bifidobacterium sp. ESL0798]